MVLFHSKMKPTCHEATMFSSPQCILCHHHYNQQNYAHTASTAIYNLIVFDLITYF